MKFENFEKIKTLLHDETNGCVQCVKSIGIIGCNALQDIIHIVEAYLVVVPRWSNLNGRVNVVHITLSIIALVIMLMFCVSCVMFPAA